jgi:hypothetical protein
MGKFGEDLTQIAVLLIGVAFAALIIGHAQGAGSIIATSTTGFNSLLNTVELGNTASNTPYNDPGAAAGGGVSGGGVSNISNSLGGF